MNNGVSEDCDIDEEFLKTGGKKYGDDMLKTLPGVDPKKHKSGIVGFTGGIIGFITAFTQIFYIPAVLFTLGFLFSAYAVGKKKTKINRSAFIINLIGIFVSAALIVLAETHVI